ncbi:MAG: bifunctional DNA primase/polymerase [Gemmatimonadales bacterium]
MSTIESTTPGVAWTAIRDAAVAAATRGRPVPGTYTRGVTGRWYGREGATGLGPADDHWQKQGITEWSDAHAVWTRRPYGVLLVCGRGVDALELPTRLAQDVFPALGAAGPIVALHPARWVLLVASGHGPAPKLGTWPSVTYRGPGHWVPLPPTGLDHTRARWHVRPPLDEAVILPASELVQRTVIDTLGGGGS